MMWLWITETGSAKHVSTRWPVTLDVSPFNGAPFNVRETIRKQIVEAKGKSLAQELVILSELLVMKTAAAVNP